MAGEQHRSPFRRVHLEVRTEMRELRPCEHAPDYWSHWPVLEVAIEVEMSEIGRRGEAQLLEIVFPTARLAENEMGEVREAVDDFGQYLEVRFRKSVEIQSSDVSQDAALEEVVVGDDVLFFGVDNPMMLPS